MQTQQQGKKGLNSVEVGRDYLKRGKYKEAAQKFQTWLNKYPTDKNTWLDYGACLYHMAQLDRALTATKRALELDPDFSLAHNNIGLYYQMINDGATAVKWYSQAANKGYPDANFNLALSMLRQLMDNLSFGKEWDDAWEMYSWRFKKSSPVPLPRVPKHMKLWDGNGPVMVLTEQGVGDTVMFSRYMDLCPAGSVFAIPEALNPIFKGRYTCINDTQDAGEVTSWIPAADLCKFFKEIPAGVVSSGGSKIGVCWQGNKDHANDHNRSYPKLKKEMLALPDAVSLQFGHNKDIESWEDTLNLLKDCKTVVTVDTSIAHVAGYLGIRTLVLMPKFDWDFRWGTGRKNHWYPSVEAFSTWEELLAAL